MTYKTLHITTFALVFLSVIIAKPLFAVTGIEAVKIFPVALLLLGTLRYAFFRKGYIFIGKIRSKIPFIIFSIFILVYAISLIRHSLKESYIGTINETFQIILIVTFTFSWLNFQFKKSKDFSNAFSNILYTLIISSASFIVINVLFYFLGIQGVVEDTENYSIENPSMESSSVTAQLLGLSLNRSGLFFTGHPNNFALVVGAVVVCIVVALLFLELNSTKKKLLWIILPICCFSLLLLDSRGSIGSIVLTLFVFYLIRRFNLLGLSKSFIFIVPILPVLSLFFLGLMAESDWAASLTRGGKNDIMTGNGRLYIWTQCLNVISDVQAEHFIGYGQVGHIASGADKLWSYIFPGKFAHNFFFQVFFDVGYIGIILFLCLFYIVLNSSIDLYKKGYKQAVVFISFMIYFILSGTFECGFGVYNRFYTDLFIVFILAAIIIKNKYDTLDTNISI